MNTAQLAEAIATAIDQSNVPVLVESAFVDGITSATKGGHSFDVEIGGQVFKIQVTESA